MDSILNDLLNRIKNLEEKQKVITTQLDSVSTRLQLVYDRMNMLERIQNKDLDSIQLKKEIKYIWEDIKRIDSKISR